VRRVSETRSGAPGGGVGLPECGLTSFTLSWISMNWEWVVGGWLAGARTLLGTDYWRLFFAVRVALMRPVERLLPDRWLFRRNALMPS